MVAGESIAVIINELYGKVVKVIKTDSLSAVAILCHDGGSWRTRHLRLRAAYARQAVISGDWLIQHVPGDVMVADLGTKALTAARMELLKKLMGMGKLKKEKEDEEEKERRTGQQASKKDEERRTGQQAEKEDEEEKERRTGQQADKNMMAKTAQVIKLITLAASISVTKVGEERWRRS